MNSEPFDYTAILADLEAKKMALEQTIVSFRQAMAMGALGQMGDGSGIVPSVNVPSMTGGEVPAGAFLGKSIPEASKLYLEMVKKKQTSREIADALEKGGMETTSKNFAAIVHAILDRARKQPNAAIVKIGSQWGLAGWYPKGIVSAAAPQAKNGKKKRAKAKPPTPLALPAAKEKTTAETGKANERALAFIQSKPQGEHSLQEVATHLGIGEKGVRLILGKLVKQGKVRMSAPGTYTVAPFSVEAAVAS